jgi:uncharacterized SAM-binding protein YcdF (DUF218 family)
VIVRALLNVALRLLLTGLLLYPLSLALIDGYGQLDRAQPADAIVVLGARVYPPARPGPALTRRTYHAVALYQRGLAPVIICSGGLGPVPPTEAEAACRLAASLGVPPEALLLEARSHSTEENALYTAELMAAHGWNSVIVVSDGFHLYRAGLLFAHAGLTPHPSPAQHTVGPMPLRERYARITRELAAVAWFWGKGLVGLEMTNFPWPYW